MKAPTVGEFVAELELVLGKYFVDYSLEVQLKTSQSYKVNVMLSESVFIAVRYNARNERTDFALIEHERRIFGYDNLKQWHYHPFENPSIHVPCAKPSIDKILEEIKTILTTH